MVEHSTHIPKVKGLIPDTDTSGLHYKNILTIVSDDRQ
jgi:hypothetical protein